MCLMAMMDTIKSCLLNQTVDVSRLSTFDIEYMFTQLRAKSVGEVSTIVIRCKDCDHANEYSIDLDRLEVTMPDHSKVEDNAPTIQITETIAVEMRYPSYRSLMDGDVVNSERDMTSAIKLIANSISAVLEPDSRTDARDCTAQDLIAFVESMTASQLKKLTEFLENIPALKHDAKFKCKECGEDNELELKGLSDFF